MSKQFSMLAEGFRFDLWANRMWLECLASKGNVETDFGIFRHILAAQEIWLNRCQGESPTAMPVPEVSEAKLQELHKGWISVLSGQTEDRIVAYRNTRGEAYEQSVSRIAAHVIDHGTYHRGELRGLCRARDDTDFPETSIIGFYMALASI